MSETHPQVDQDVHQANMGGWLARRSQANLAESERHIPLQIASDLHAVTRMADVSRRDELLRAFEHLREAVLASDSTNKINELRRLLVALIGEQGNDVLTAALMTEAEIASPKVIEVAGQKAREAYKHHLEQSDIPIDERIIKLIQLFKFSHAINAGEFEELKELMPRGVAFLGADVNFWRYAGNGVWQQELKLERMGRELTDGEFMRLVEEMKAQYCHPPHGEVRVLWDIGVVVLNGGVHEFHDQIEVIAKPIDEWLFMQYMMQARESGLLYSANPHMALIECLIAQDNIKTIATLSNEEQRAGVTIEQKRLKPCAADLAILQASIRGNRPPRIPD